jgi:hypothetical protein
VSIGVVHAEGALRMATPEQERLWLAQAERQLANLDKEIKVSERRLKELNDGGYFGDEQTYEEALATLTNAYAQMRAHRRQVNNRLDQLGRPASSHPREATASFAYRSAQNIRRSED